MKIKHKKRVKWNQKGNQNQLTIPLRKNMKTDATMMTKKDTEIIVSSLCLRTSDVRQLLNLQK